MFNLRYTKSKFWKFLVLCPWKHPLKLCLQGTAVKAGHFLLSIVPFDQKLVYWLCCPTWLKANKSKAKLLLNWNPLIFMRVSFQLKVWCTSVSKVFHRCFTMLSEILSSFTMLSLHLQPMDWRNSNWKTGIKSKENHTCNTMHISL